jgi:type IV secretory pathway VirB10-like protein
MNQPIEVREKAPKPAGLLPKNVQSWLLVGLAVLMVLIMWVTGGKKPGIPGKTLSAGTSVPRPLEVNETKIADLQNRIQELQREQLVAQSALAQQTRLIGAAGQDPQHPSEPSVTSSPSPERGEDPVEAEQKKRAYLSLFASNIALSYRKATALEPTTETETASAIPNTPRLGPDTAQIAQILKEMPPNPIPLVSIASTPRTVAEDSQETTQDRKEEGKKSATPSGRVANAATGKTYLLFEGTILETVLINRLDGQFRGPVECLLSTDVYSNDRQHLLVPAGSKVLGETRKVDTFGQTRLAVAFHRLLMPDGYSTSLDQFKGLNQIGDAGLRDQVNNHYIRIFGVSLAIGAIGAVGAAGTAGSLTSSGTDLMRQGFAQSTAQSSAQILERFLNIMPTVTIREGHRVKIYLSGDLALPDYTNHKMPPDL